jgi:hypothetical protein
MPGSLSKKKNKKTDKTKNEAEETPTLKFSEKNLNNSDDSDSLSTDRDLKVNPSIDAISTSASKTPGADVVVIPNAGNKETREINNLTSGHRSELEYLMEDVRESLSEKSLTDSSSQVLPGSGYLDNKQKPEAIRRIDDWMSERVKVPYLSDNQGLGSKRRLSPIRFAILLLSLFCLGYLFVIYSNTLKSAPAPVIPTTTPVPTYSIPFPISIELPGGWNILLATSKNLFPDWKPIQPEWLNGTTICKLIALPWNKQIDAVFNTIVPGDKIKLTMSNQDQFPYQVESLSRMPTNKLTDMINSNEPCMIIFIYKEGSSTNQTLKTVPSTP